MYPKAYSPPLVQVFANITPELFTPCPAAPPIFQCSLFVSKEIPHLFFL